jgi:hypothetical protein
VRHIICRGSEGVQCGVAIHVSGFTDWLDPALLAGLF